MTDALMRAAHARGLDVARRSDRPLQRRCAEFAEAPARANVPARMEIRAAGDDPGPLRFEGVASVTEHGYRMWDMFGEYTEIVDEAAFDESLARADLDVPLVLAHDQLRRIARTTAGSLLLSRSDEGLAVLAPELDPEDTDVAYIARKLRAGLVDEMSFAFRIDEGEWSPDYTQYRIRRADIHRGDVAIVGYGANPATYGGLRASARPADMRAMLLDLAIARA